MSEQATPNFDDVDLKNSGVYAEHLSEVNKTKQVIATEDIFNDKGVLLVPKGAPINPKVAAQITKHKLTKPMAHQVNVEGAIASNGLYEQLLKILDEKTEATVITKQLNLKPKLRHLCNELDSLPLLQQKLTVLSMQLPTLFDKALRLAVLCVSLAQFIKPSLDEKQIFLAALCSDLGFLHLPKDILEVKGEMTPEQWRTMQSHVVVGKYLVDDIRGLPKVVSQAVLEHHERSDGAGYPYGKEGKELCVEGQVLGLIDAVHAVLRRTLYANGYGLADLKPFLQLNHSTWQEEVYRAAMMLLAKAQLEHKRTIDDEKMATFILELQRNHGFLSEVQAELDQVHSHLSGPARDRFHRAFQLGYQRIESMLLMSGLLSEEMKRWLSHVSENKLESAYQEIEHVNLMQGELAWQYKSLIRNLDRHLNKSPLSPALAKIVTPTFESLKQKAAQMGGY